tara:strand:+ start:1237 stop:1461 length:225 start_codon:yes stop_codon:yes gene_type:complete
MRQWLLGYLVFIWEKYMSSEKSSGGIGFTGLLVITFIVLKLTSVITWSWWWVLSPIWIPFVVIVVAAAILGGKK